MTRKNQNLCFKAERMLTALTVVTISLLIASCQHSQPSPIRNSIGMEFIYVPKGSFMMGSTDTQVKAANDQAKRYSNPAGEWFTNEKPQHQVTFSEGFYVGKDEVTQGQWKSVMGTTMREQHDKFVSGGGLVGEGDNYPMYYVSWDEAQEFIRRLNARDNDYVYRLPSEAEWEYACRAGTTEDYAGNLDGMAWYHNNSGDKILGDADNEELAQSHNRTHPVGQKQPNAFGLYDMHGNVQEWCEDYYHENYNGAPTDGKAWVNGGDSTSRILRGGAWHLTSIYLRSAYRRSGTPSNRNYDIGFRVVAVPRR